MGFLYFGCLWFHDSVLTFLAAAVLIPLPIPRPDQLIHIVLWCKRLIMAFMKVHQVAFVLCHIHLSHQIKPLPLKAFAAASVIENGHSSAMAEDGGGFQRNRHTMAVANRISHGGLWRVHGGCVGHGRKGGNFILKNETEANRGLNRVTRPGFSVQNG